MSDNRSYVAGKFYFNLDGIPCGYVKGVDGGGITAEVISQASGPSYFSKKSIGGPKYEDFNMQLGFAVGKPVFQWIGESWRGNYQRKNGTVVSCNAKMEAVSQREFFNAIVTETGIPACDGSSKEAAYLTLKFAPEYTRVTKASGKADGSFGKNEQKLWLPSNFRLEAPGLDATKVKKIDAITIKQTAVTNDVGDARDYEKEPGKLEFPNLKITLSENSSESWHKWHEDFVIKGNNDESQEKILTLSFLSSNRQDTLGTVTMYNCGIFKLNTSKAEAGGDTIKSVDAELYCERMEIEVTKGQSG